MAVKFSSSVLTVFSDNLLTYNNEKKILIFLLDMYIKI